MTVSFFTRRRASTTLFASPDSTFSMIAFCFGLGRATFCTSLAVRGYFTGEDLLPHFLADVPGDGIDGEGELSGTLDGRTAHFVLGGDLLSSSLTLRAALSVYWLAPVPP